MGKQPGLKAILALQVSDFALPGPIPNRSNIHLHLPVQSSQALAFLPGQSRLVFLVDDLVEALVQEYRESLSPVGRGGDVVGVVVGYLRNVIGEVSHTWMIRRWTAMGSDGLRWALPWALERRKRPPLRSPGTRGVSDVQ